MNDKKLRLFEEIICIESGEWLLKGGIKLFVNLSLKLKGPRDYLIVLLMVLDRPPLYGLLDGDVEILIGVVIPIGEIFGGLVRMLLLLDQGLIERLVGLKINRLHYLEIIING
jgi:hypothetical protein